MPVGTVLFSLPNVADQPGWLFFRYACSGFWKLSVKNGANCCSTTAILPPAFGPASALSGFDRAPSPPSAPPAAASFAARANSALRAKEADSHAGTSRSEAPCASSSLAIRPPSPVVSPGPTGDDDVTYTGCSKSCQQSKICRIRVGEPEAARP